MTPDELRDELLAEIRKAFYSGVSPQEWCRDKTMLITAICWPARWLNELGGKLPGSRYREILRGIISDTAAHVKQGTYKRRAAYFLVCVQRHMMHQGERYLEEAKGGKIVGPAAGKAVVRMKVSEPDHTVRVLAETHKMLTASRKPKAKAGAETQKELF